MEDVYGRYTVAIYQIEQLFGDGSKCPSKEVAAIAQAVVHKWQDFARSKLDAMTALTFDGINGPSQVPMSWSSFHMEGVVALNAYLTMKKQMAWLGEQRTAKPSGPVTVHAHNSVVTVGSNNTVHANVTNLNSGLDELVRAIKACSLDSAAKADLVEDVETIRSQVKKSKPDAGIITSAWARVKDVAAAGGFVSTVQMVWPYLQHLIG